MTFGWSDDDDGERWKKQLAADSSTLLHSLSSTEISGIWVFLSFWRKGKRQRTIQFMQEFGKRRQAAVTECDVKHCPLYTTLLVFRATGPSAQEGRRKREKRQAGTSTLLPPSSAILRSMISVYYSARLSLPIPSSSAGQSGL